MSATEKRLIWMTAEISRIVAELDAKSKRSLIAARLATIISQVQTDAIVNP